MDFLVELLLDIELPGRSDFKGETSSVSVYKRKASKEFKVEWVGSKASPSVFNLVDGGEGDAAMLNTTTGTFSDGWSLSMMLRESTVDYSIILVSESVLPWLVLLFLSVIIFVSNSSSFFLLWLSFSRFDWFYRSSILLESDISISLVDSAILLVPLLRISSTSQFDRLS